MERRIGLKSNCVAFCSILDTTALLLTAMRQKISPPICSDIWTKKYKNAEKIPHCQFVTCYRFSASLFQQYGTLQKLRRIHSVTTFVFLFVVNLSKCL